MELTGSDCTRIALAKCGENEKEWLYGSPPVASATEYGGVFNEHANRPGEAEVGCTEGSEDSSGKASAMGASGWGECVGEGAAGSPPVAAAEDDTEKGRRTMGLSS
jgi:hypothetical protein